MISAVIQKIAAVFMQELFKFMFLHVNVYMLSLGCGYYITS